MSIIKLMFLSALVIPITLFAQKSENDTVSSGWGLYPVVFYTDQTSLAFGGHGVYFFLNKNARHPSTINADIIYTFLNPRIRYA